MSGRAEGMGKEVRDVKVTINGKPKEIAALVVGLQGRQGMGQSSNNHDEGNRESMIKALEGRLARLKSDQSIM